MGSDSSPGTRPRGGRAYWVRANLAPPPSGERSTSARTPGKRFVEPYRLTREQRARMIARLEEKAVGDAEGRNLFVSAMEYDLAGCRELPVTEGPKPKKVANAIQSREADPALRELATAARDLAERLADLDETASGRLIRGLEASDRYERSYGGDYLDALRRELARIAFVGRDMARPAKPAPPPKPVVPEAARKFVLRAADAFRDCFELEADVRRGSPFLVALKAVADGTEVNIPTDRDAVAEILDLIR